MGGYSPKSRAGLIALLAARRITAEKLRREKLAETKTGPEPLVEARRKKKRFGWFRR